MDPLTLAAELRANRLPAGTYTAKDAGAWTHFTADSEGRIVFTDATDGHLSHWGVRGAITEGGWFPYMATLIESGALVYSETTP